MISPTTAPSTRTAAAAHPGRDRPHVRRAPRGRARRAARTRAPRAASPPPARPRPVVRDRQQLHQLAERAARRGSRRAAPRPGRPPRAASAARPAGRPRRRPPSSPRRPAPRSAPAPRSGRASSRAPSSASSPAWARSQSTRSSQPATSGPSGSSTSPGRSSNTTVGAPSVRRSVIRNPNPIASTPLALHPVQPRPGLLARGRRGEVEPGVALPGADVQRRVGHLALHDPRVDARSGSQERTRSGQSSPRTCSHEPEQLGHAARREVSGSARSERGERRVAVLAGVAVDVVDPRGARARTAGWTRSGRTAGPPPVPATARRAARRRASLSANVARARASARGATSVAVTGPRVPGRVQRLHPAPGAEVEQRSPPGAGRSRRPGSATPRRRR